MSLVDFNQFFTWYKIFLIIGLDKSFPFLFDIGFPLHSQYRKIQAVSRDFVKKVFDNELKLFEKDKPSQLFEVLFQEVDALLIQQIGEENVRLFWNWGNKLKLDHKIKPKLLDFWSSLTKLFRIDSNYNDPETFLLNLLINRYNHYLRGIDNALYDIENIPRNEWEELAYTLYYRIGDDRRKTSVVDPLDFLNAVIIYNALLGFIIQLQIIPEIEATLARLGLDEAYAEIKQLLA